MSTASASVVPAQPPKRCQHGGCKVRLGITAFPCKCQHYFCSLHRVSEDHGCTYDYAAAGRLDLLKTMSSPVLAAKVEVI